MAGSEDDMSSGSQQLPLVGSAPYARLMQVVSKYLSVRTAITLVNKSLIELGLTPESMSSFDLPAVIDHMMSSLRAFVPDAQIDELVLDLSTLNQARHTSDVVARPRTSDLPPPMPGVTRDGSISSLRRR